MEGTAILVGRGRDFGPLSVCGVDWNGEVVEPPVHYGFLLSDDALHFRARRETTPVGPSGVVAGAFQEELWKHEVAEFFLSHPENGSYLEVNLSPQGAWWSCFFRAPREPREGENRPLEGVHTASTLTADRWEATLRIPLAILRASPVGFGEGWGLNATFIVDFPNPRFLTACPLGSGEPDFHRPQAFPAWRDEGGA